MSFTVLKEEAKGLLLKGCYRMAINKYAQAIQLLPQGTDARTAAIVHLNHGICLQFLEKPEQALKSVSQAIRIDPSYDKAYFRRVQILVSLKRYEQALAVPHKIMNEQISKLLEDVRQEYALRLSELEWQNLHEKVQKCCIDHNWALLRKLNISLQQKYSSLSTEELRKQLQTETLYKYLQLANSLYKQSPQLVQLCCQLIFRLLIPKKIENCSHFWSLFLSLQAFNTPTTTNSTHVIKLIGLCPLLKFKESENVINFCVTNFEQLKQHKHFWDSLLLTLDSGIGLPVLSQPFSKLYMRVSQHCRDTLSSSNQIVLDVHQIMFNLLKSMNINLAVDTSNTFLKALNLKCQISSRSPTTVTLQPHTMEQILQLIYYDLDTPTLFIINDILNRIANIKSIKECPNFPSAVLKLKELITSSQTERYILLSTILVKISHPSQQKIDINCILKIDCQNPRLLCHMLELLYMFSISSTQSLKTMLQVNIRTILQQIIVNIKKNPVTVLNIKLSGLCVELLGALMIDWQESAQAHYADKMGVEVEKIKAVRMLQGDIKKEEQETLNRLRQNMMQQSQWLISILEYLSADPSTPKNLLKSIIRRFCKLFPNRYFSSNFIDLFLDNKNTDKFTMEDTFIFFGTICKKCNPQILLYRHQLPILNILVESLSKSLHQLTIFECLLSIVNLSTLSIDSYDIKPICRMLLEQNQYILHATLEILNNFLLKGKQFFDQLSETDLKIIRLLLKQYTKQLEQETDKPSTDYSHPHKIYTTLVSLFMVLDDYTKSQQIQNFQSVMGQVKKINNNEQLLIKCIHFYNLKGNLNKKYLLQHLKPQLINIQKGNPQTWSTIHKLIGSV